MNAPMINAIGSPTPVEPARPATPALAAAMIAASAMSLSSAAIVLRNSFMLFAADSYSCAMSYSGGCAVNRPFDTATRCATQPEAAWPVHTVSADCEPPESIGAHIPQRVGEVAEHVGAGAHPGLTMSYHIGLWGYAVL